MSVFGVETHVTSTQPKCSLPRYCPCAVEKLHAPDLQPSEPLTNRSRVHLYRDQLQLYLRGQRTLLEVITAKSASIGAHFRATMSAIDLNQDGFNGLEGI